MSPQPFERRVVDEPGIGLVLIVPPNPTDVRFWRIHFAGMLQFIWACAALTPMGLLARIVFLALGVPLAWCQANALMTNVVVPTRFVFQPDGTVLRTTLSRKLLNSSPKDEIKMELRRKATSGGGRLEWSNYGEVRLAMDLNEEDFNLLKEYGLKARTVGSRPLRTRLTRLQRQILWVMLPTYSLPWWIGL